MDSLESSVKDCVAAITSTRATDRKKNAEILKDYLTRNAVPSLLTENSRKKRGITWNDVFEDINQYILKETEKFETSKSFANVVAPLCTSLLHLCVSGSNKGKVYIKCDKVIDSCLMILQDNRLTEAIGDAYLSLLYKHILPYEYYVQHITPSSWEDLLNTSIKICLKGNSKLDDFTNLRLLSLIIKNGTHCCQIVIALRDSLPKMKKCFLKHMTDKKIKEVVTEIIILLLEELSSECRLTMCEFLESVLLPILKYYDQNTEHKKKSNFFKLLQLTVIVHHPCGRLQSESGSLANDWEIWNKHMQNILEIICLETLFLQKSRIHNNLQQDHTYFYQLAATVYYQIFHLTTEANTEAGTSSKKQRTTYNKCRSFSDAIEELPQNPTPWFGIVHAYIEKYKSYVFFSEYLTLLNTLEEAITNNTVYVKWEKFEELICLILNNLINDFKDDSNSKKVTNVVLNLWNSCVRNTSSNNTSPDSLHKIMQIILETNVLSYQNVEPMLKLYFENAIPLTEISLRTLNCIFYKYFKKCSHSDVRIKCFAWWWSSVDKAAVDIKYTKEFMLRLLSNENIGRLNNEHDLETTDYNDKVFDTLYNSIEKSILFSELELDIPRHSAPMLCTMPKTNEDLQYELNIPIDNHLRVKFEQSLIEVCDKLENNNIKLLEVFKFMNAILSYIDTMLKHDFVIENSFKETDIYLNLRKLLKYTCNELIRVLEGPMQTNEKNDLLQNLENIFLTEFCGLLNNEVRCCVHDIFFKCLYNIMSKEVASHEDKVYEEDDVEVNPNVLKHRCITVMAAYCRKRAGHRDEILRLILDYESYDFSSSWDIECAFQCIRLLNNNKVDELPIDLLFTFMKSICKELFRSSKVTFVMLKLLSEVMVSAWSDQTLRENVSIMVRGYVQRCDTRYYSPRVAARAFQCAARQLLLPRADTEQLRSVLHHNLTGEVHSIRLYCCTLLDHVFADLSKPEIDSYITDLLEIFTINTSNIREQTLKDEHLNRTLILLHCFSVLAENSKSLTHGIVTRLLQIQRDKSLDERLVKKVLNRITKAVAGKDVEQYLNGNILSVLHFWFTKNNSLDDFPLYLFGFEDMSVFLKKHMHCLIPVETLYSKRGDFKSSEALKQTKQRFGKSDQDIIENCFCSIITLSLPQILIKEHKLAVIENGELVRSADRMFHSTRAIIGDKKWSDLFTENIGSLVSLSAQLLRDTVGARAFVDLPYDLSHLDSYHYSKRVFEAILKYFSDLIDENIVECLCNSQPTAIFKTLFDLWECVTNEFVFEYKMLCLHGYMFFVEKIPPGGRCEAFVSSFTWRSIAEAVRVGKDMREIAAMTKALQLALDQRPTLGTHAPRAPLATALSILAVKAEEGYRTECESLLYYLTVEMKDQLKASQDVLDFVNAMSQGDIDEFCGSTLGLKKKLESFHTNLSSASHEVLINLKSCLKKNKQYINGLYNELDIKGFSEDCNESIIHKVISSLCDIINISDNNKTKILACDCLATIGRYDLKTLVTVPPKDTKRITQMGPNKYFAVVVVKSLVEVMFDATLSVTNDAVQCLNKLFSYLEASYALDCDEIDRQILIPFSSSNCNQLAEFKINELKFVEQFSSQFWIPRNKECHTHWLTRITDSLLEVLTTTNNYVTTLRVVCNSKPNMCRKILPALVGLLLFISSSKHIQEISTQINAFFDYIWEISFDLIFGDSEGHENKKNTISTLGHDHRMIVQYMLDIVDLVRLQKNIYRKRSDRGGGTGPLNYLGVRYDRVACAAAAATQHLPAIYYAEMHAAGDPSSTTLANDRDLQRILRKCFISIGEMDAIEGCGAAHLTEERGRRNYLLHSGHYTDSLLMHDIALSHKESPSSGLQCGLVTSLYKAGLHHVALQYIDSLPENEQLDDVKYDCLSILGDWNDIVDTEELEAKSKLQDANINSIIKTFRYACLKDCLNIQSTKDCKLTVPLNKAKLAVSRLCQVLNMENCQSVYKTIEKLHLLTDIEDYFAVRCGTMTIYELLRQWRVDNLPACNDFKHLEALILQRNLILKHASKSYNNLMQEIVSLQLDYVEVGLSQQCVQMAQCLVAGGRGRWVDEGCTAAVRLAEARVAWARQHRQVALAVLGDLLQNNSTDAIPGPIAAIALRQYGTWMAESKCDNPKNIINKYLKKSLEMLNRNDHSATRVSVYYDVAKFADSEYKQVVSYMNSSTFENKLKCVNNMKDTASNLQATQLRLTKDEYVAFTTNSKFSALDEEEIINTRAEKKTYLELAMRYYLLHLKQSEDNNLSMFRVISLWLDNTDHSFETEGESFEELLHAVPSRKFLSVLPQLAPRLSNDNTPFARTLSQIIAKCATEHPHHTLPILFSLKNSEKDKYILNASGDSGARGNSGGGGGAARTSAAAALVSQLAASNPRLATIIKQMDKLCDAIISFANYQPPSKETKQNIPSAENIHKLGHMNAIPVPIDNIAIRNDCNYSHISTLVSFESYFELVGGINCPKKITCTISDGRRKIMLIKGKDDLRQDAVMQQVFNIVNNLLENDPITSRSKLLIRTYKVVAMSRRSGALEWCAGTMPLSAFLCGPNGAHARYRPQDISAEAAAKKLKDCHDQRQSNAVKLFVFKSILRDFKPVFHYFFTEHYLDPVTWYERRLAYIKSVAASSMVGYILGLGDRHVNNILIDKNTAEVIHIDFGIAFEQGRTLRTEETVPFRLTQDIIAGFGSCGTEGIFKKCCEKTMQLLRDNQEILLTILEVLLYDPLYSWSVISTQPNANGGVGGEGKAGLAERTLLSVRSKLSGTEGGVAGGVAVSGQVAGLIRAATDPANLSRLFYGWRAYL